MTINFKNIFRIDACGALITAVLVGLVLPQFNSFIGLSSPMLYCLATIALIYSTFSFVCSQFLPPKKKFLLAIIAANLFYCLITALTVAIHFKEMSGWGILYFFGEIAIILSLASIEWKIFRSTNS